MKIIILGAGGVGGYYGGLLALHGQEVTFIAHGAHLDAIRQDGLMVKSVNGDFQIQPARATDSPAEAGVGDLVLVCTKTTSDEAVFRMLPEMVGPDTTVMSLQNGVDAVERIGAVIGMEHMLGGATWISSAVESPGVIRQITQFRRVVAGELDGRLTPRLQAVAGAFQPTGITFETSTEFSKVLWTKFIFIAAVSGVGALTRLAVGEYRAVPETRSLLMGIMGEVECVALALGISMDADAIEKTLAFIDTNVPANKPSMQKDVEAGNPFELETIIGVIGRKGRECGVPTPIADFIHAALLPVYLKAGGKV
jgi:2-dehydropantoate 2-reductase